MAKKRTRAQKQQARHVYHLPKMAETTREVKTVARTHAPHAVADLFTLDARVLTRDLLKTFFLCLLIISIEISLWWLWR